MADQMKSQLLKCTLIKDKRAKRIKQAFDTLPEFNLNCRELNEEITTIHAVRKTRGLDRRSDTFIQDLINGMIDDQAQRSRLVEILMVCVKTIRNLEDTLDSLSGYLQMEYSEQIASVAKTKAERSSFIENQVLRKFRKYVAKVDTIKETTALVITDIDKAGFVYKNLIEAVKLSSGGNRQI
jgi:hypothetical protein